MAGIFPALGPAHSLPQFEMHLAFPWPTLGFIYGFEKALSFLPLALPFALVTIVGGINVTESARVAGDEYKTRDVLLTEALATVVAALFGGVAQTTPYIGHSAYKAMGGRAAYTLATGLFVGLGGVLGCLSFIVEAIPEAAITPILMFVGIEIVAQAFAETPRKHTPAVAFSIIPVVGYLVLVNVTGVLSKLGPAVSLPAVLANEQQVLQIVGNGFILTAMLWGGLLADLIDGKVKRASFYCLLCAIFSLFGVIHSVSPSGDMYLPWRVENILVWQVSIGYALVALLFLGLSRTVAKGTQPHSAWI